MPQVTKGGKYLFGWSRVGENGAIMLPAQAAQAYDIASEGAVILFTGSKSTGGFCVTRKGLWLPSKLGFVLEALPRIAACSCRPCSWTAYKGQSYCWSPIAESGEMTLPPETLSFLSIRTGEVLLSIVLALPPVAIMHASLPNQREFGLRSLTFRV